MVMAWEGLGAAPSTLNGGSHASFPYALNAFNAALGNALSAPYPAGVHGDFIPTAPTYATLPAAMVSTGAAYLAGGTTTPTVNNAPYEFSNLSLCCWSTNGAFTQFVPMDAMLYASLETQGAIEAISYGGTAFGTNPRPISAFPGIVTTTGSATNSTDGGTGGGIEFGLSASYLGLNTGADSWISAELAGFYQAMQYQHPTWNVWDIKGALRQTAGNWATGYNPAAYGFGNLAYSSATAIGSPAAVFLQGPGMAVVTSGGFATITLYPFRQTRRVNEQIYSVSAAYVWPVKNEYTTADITASGATLLYSSNGTDQEPTYTFPAAVIGTVTFVSFTLDGAGGFSRIEAAYSPISVFLAPFTTCVGP
jgi:hypothetical protein